MVSIETIEITLLVILIGLSGFFSASEAALLAMSRSRLKQLISQKKPEAEKIRKLMAKPNVTISTIVIGNNIVNISASAIATGLAIQTFGNAGIGIATGVMTLTVLIFGEIVPKTYAMRHAEKTMRKGAGLLIALNYILYPMMRILTPITSGILKALGTDVSKRPPKVTEEEIKTLVGISEEEGVIEKREREMIYKVFEFGDTEVREIMTPRMDIIGESENKTIGQAIKKALDSGVSRIPIYKKTRDRIQGIVYVKDLLEYITKRKTGTRLKSLTKPVLFVPETKKLDKLFKEMQEKKIHMAIVVDEYGGTAGLVTLEDILEELVGDIYDEYDITEKEIQKIDEKTSIVDAKMNIDEINEILKTDLPEKEVDTIGGYVYKRLGKKPKNGEKIRAGKHMLIIEEMDGQRVGKIRIILKEKKKNRKKSRERK